MIRRVAEPLPECGLCERPMTRRRHEELGGLCTECTDGIAETVKLLPVARRLPPAPDDLTVFVEKFTPPVPGQTALRVLPGGRSTDADA